MLFHLITGSEGILFYVPVVIRFTSPLSNPLTACVYHSHLRCPANLTSILYIRPCFDENVTEETVTAVAKIKPLYIVMRDSSMSNDSVATNFEQIFKTYSADTVRKVI